jgi:hypothetical protein
MKLSLLTSVVALASSAFAASLQQVTNYGSNPSNVSVIDAMLLSNQD